MDLELRAITEPERMKYHRAIATAFGDLPTEEQLEAWGDALPVDRTIAVFDDERIIATAAAFSFDLTVPGGAQLATAGVTAVGVHPTHRRRGLLRRMMDEQLDDVARRGEPLAVLTASESSIYGRFGYGLATFGTAWELATDRAVLGSPPETAGHLRLVDRADAPAIVGAIYDAAARTRVGEVTRDDKYWARVYREQAGPASPEGEDAPSFTVVHRDESGHDDGFARYAVTMQWPHGQASNTLRVIDLHAIDPAVEAALWEFLVNVDLVTTIKASDRPVDESLRWRLSEPRRLTVRQVTDHLWVRVLDVATALSARTYAVADELVLEIVDPFRPENDGCWLVDGSPTDARCARTDRAPDLTMSIDDLGAIYLGGVAPSTLARAGRVHERTPGSLARADTSFTIHPAPWCSTHF